MPDWIKNRATFIDKPASIDRLIKLVKTETKDFDFNGIVFMPKDLGLEAGGIKESTAKACALARREGKTTCPEFENPKYTDTELSFNDWANLGEKYFYNFKVYGAYTWYDWCIAHWGTKWNASDVIWEDEYTGSDYKSVILSFETAWNFPKQIFDRIHEMFPNMEIMVEYASENFTGNNGIYTLNWEGKSRWILETGNMEFGKEVWGV